MSDWPSASTFTDDVEPWLSRLVDEDEALTAGRTRSVTRGRRAADGARFEADQVAA
jgi:hypothetical protein